MFFGHWLEILLLLFLALLVFGPKKMIEMGSSFGRMFRELREATRDMSWTNILSDHEDHSPKPPFSQTPFTNGSQPQSFASEAERAAHERAAERARAAASSQTIVESTIEHPPEPPAE